VNHSIVRLQALVILAGIMPAGLAEAQRTRQSVVPDTSRTTAKRAIVSHLAGVVLSIDAVTPSSPKTGDMLTIRYTLSNFSGEQATGVVTGTFQSHPLTAASRAPTGGRRDGHSKPRISRQGNLSCLSGPQWGETDRMYSRCRNRSIN